MINFEESLMKEFIKGAERWVSEDNCRQKSIEINNWQNKRIYVNIKYHTVRVVIFVLHLDKIIIKIDSAKNASIRNGLENVRVFINNNFDEFIERYGK